MKKIIISVLICFISVLAIAQTGRPFVIASKMSTDTLKIKGTTILQDSIITGGHTIKFPTKNGTFATLGDLLTSSNTTHQYVNGFLQEVNLNTDSVSEGSTNKYYTNARTITSILTGYSSSPGTITPADNILVAIDKLNGNIGGKLDTTTAISLYQTKITFPNSGGKYYNGFGSFGLLRADSVSLAGYISGAGTVSSADNSLTAIQKLNGNIAALVTGVSSVNTKTGSVALILNSADFANEGTTITLLHGNGSGNPAFGQVVNADIANSTIDLTTKVTGALPITNGGTNNASLSMTSGTIFYSDGTKIIGLAPAPHSGMKLTMVSGVPVWQDTTTGGASLAIGATVTSAVVSRMFFAGSSGTLQQDANITWDAANHWLRISDGTNTFLLGANLQGTQSNTDVPYYSDGALRMTLQKDGKFVIGNGVSVGSAIFQIINGGTQSWSDGITTSVAVVNGNGFNIGINQTSALPFNIYTNNIPQDIFTSNGSLIMNVRNATSPSVILTERGANLGFPVYLEMPNTPGLPYAHDVSPSAGLINENANGFSWIDMTDTVPGPSSLDPVGAARLGIGKYHGNFGMFSYGGKAVKPLFHQINYVTNAVMQTDGTWNFGTDTTRRGFGWVDINNSAGAQLGLLHDPTNYTTLNTGASGILVVTPTGNESDFIGTLKTGGFRVGYIAKTANYTIVPTTDYYIDCTSGSFTITLPTAVGISGQPFVINNSGGGTITLATTGGQSVQGGLTGVATIVRLVSDGANWKTN